MKKLVVIAILMNCYFAYSQQNHTLFFLHQVPQVNFLNPAVQAPCKLYIGLPVLSSFHINAANNGFTFNRLISKQGDDYVFNAPEVEKHLAGKNYLMTEVYTNLLAIGVKRKNYYYTFGIRERNDLAFFYTHDLISLLYSGNSGFEGKSVGLKNNGVNFNHFREFSLGISKKTDEGIFYGIRGKLLFGKLNATTSDMDAALSTEENTYNLYFSGGFKINASLPRRFSYDVDSMIRLNGNYNPSLTEIIFNRKNWGIAMDAGFIYQRDEDVTFSGSILDLGFISYRHDIENSNYRAEGEYEFTGFLNDIGDYVSSWRYYFDNFNAAVNDSLTHNNYTYFLSPRLYLGASRRINRRLSVNALAGTKIYREKMINGLSVTANYNLLKNASAALSWSYMHRSIKNIGVGIVAGRSPVQFYAATDNILGIIWPQSTRNINICFGFNLIFGCRNKGSDINDCGCYWLQKAEERNERKEKLRRKHSGLF